LLSGEGEGTSLMLIIADAESSLYWFREEKRMILRIRIDKSVIIKI